MRSSPPRCACPARSPARRGLQAQQPTRWRTTRAAVLQNCHQKPVLSIKIKSTASNSAETRVSQKQSPSQQSPSQSTLGSSTWRKSPPAEGHTNLGQLGVAGLKTPPEPLDKGPWHAARGVAHHAGVAGLRPRLSLGTRQGAMVCFKRGGAPAVSARAPCPVAAVQQASCSTISALARCASGASCDARPPGPVSARRITCVAEH